MAVHILEGSIENQVISKVLLSDNEEERNELLQFDSSFYGIYNKEIEFIFDFYKEYHSVPGVNIFLSNFPDFTILPLESINVPIQYFKDQLMINKQNILLNEMSLEIIENPHNLDVSSSWDYVEEKAYEAHTISPNKPHDLISDAQLRAQEMINMNNRAKVSSGFKELDDMLGGGFNTNEELAIIIARTNVGKAQPLDSKVLTPHGWKRMGDIKVGDIVVGRNNDNGQVKELFPQGKIPVFSIYFNDNTVVECCDDHLWEIKNDDSYSVITTKEMRSILKRGDKISVSISDPIVFDNDFDKENNLTPELLSFFLMNNEYREMMSERLFFVVNHYIHEELPWEKVEGLENIRSILDRYHLLNTIEQSIPHIPDEYLYGPVGIRKRLFNSIVEICRKNLDDTDPENDDYDDFEYVEFTSKELSDDFSELGRSLGLFVKQIDNNSVLYSKFIKEKTVVRIEKNKEDEECQCILLDNKTHTYLTDHYTVTHNTWFVTKLLEAAQANGFPCLMYSPEMSWVSVGSRFDSWRAHFSNADLNKGQYTDSYWDYVQKLTEEKTPAYILENRSCPGNEMTTSYLESFIRQNNIKFCIIDGLSYMTDIKDPRASDYVRYKNLAEGLFDISKTYHCVMVVSMQANRETKENKDNGVDPPFPTLYNIEGSDHPARISTLVFSLRQRYDKGLLDIRIEKARMFSHKNRVLTYTWDPGFGTAEYVPGDDDDTEFVQPTVDIGGVLGNDNVQEFEVKKNNTEEDWDVSIEF